MTQQEKEQRLLDEAEKAIDRQKFDRLSDTIVDYQQVWIDGVKSEAAREYWQSQQKQETPELEEIRKDFAKRFKKHSFLFSEIEEMFNFFAPYIKGTEWVSVKDRLPEDNKSILTYDGMLIERCDYSLARGFRDSQYIEISGITHWQPLPKAPKEVGDV